MKQIKTYFACLLIKGSSVCQDCPGLEGAPLGAVFMAVAPGSQDLTLVLERQLLHCSNISSYQVKSIYRGNKSTFSFSDFVSVSVEPGRQATQHKKELYYF